MSVVTLRRAGLSDVPLLREWEHDPDVIASGGVDDDWEWEEVLAREVPYQEEWLGCVAGQPIGVVVLLDASREPSGYWSPVEPGVWAIDIWIGAPEHRNRGFGSQMMKLALERCFDVCAASEVLIDPLVSNTRAISFYRSLGFRDVGERVFGVDTCWVLRFLRDDWSKSQSTSSSIGRATDS